MSHIKEDDDARTEALAATILATADRSWVQVGRKVYIDGVPHLHFTISQVNDQDVEVLSEDGRRENVLLWEVLDMFRPV